LVLGLCHNFARLRRSAKVRTVHRVYLEKEREIRDFVGRVAGKPIGYGDVRLRIWLTGYRRKHEVVVRNVLHIEGAHNSLSQSPLNDRGLWIVPVNGYGCKIYDKSLIDSA
jgi:hypothetical protein